MKSIQGTKIIEFGKRKFTNSWDGSGKGRYRFEIDNCWILQGFQYPVRYPSHCYSAVLDWCSEHAPNAHILHYSGRAVLFKSEMIAIMFNLTFNDTQNEF